MEKKYITVENLVKKHSFLTKNMIKNLIHKNLDNIREKCLKKFGRRILVDEDAFFKFIDDCPPTRENWQGKKNKESKCKEEFKSEDDFKELLMNRISDLTETIKNLHRKFELQDAVLKILLSEIKDFSKKLKTEDLLKGE